jgi:hypothetical protein
MPHNPHKKHRQRCKENMQGKRRVIKLD